MRTFRAQLFFSANLSFVINNNTNNNNNSLFQALGS